MRKKNKLFRTVHYASFPGSDASKRSQPLLEILHIIRLRTAYQCRKTVNNLAINTNIPTVGDMPVPVPVGL